MGPGRKRATANGLWILAILSAAVAFSAPAAGSGFGGLSHADLTWIGMRIFENECGGRKEALVDWNHGEDFASLGIGHFIWYPKGKNGPYDESFVDLVAFLRQNRAALPTLLKGGTSLDCPWPDRDAFLAAANEPDVSRLRAFLWETVGLQTRFMVRRLEAALPRILAVAAPDRKRHIRRQYQRLARTPDGLFALVDYVNFKGEGISPTERIAGHGWGLFQVLDAMDDLSTVVDPVAEFSRAAQTVLQRRAESDPRSFVRRQWLAGWLARVRAYTEIKPN